ncbi:terminase family protein [Roseicyclus sp. F158]|uniref:Terminase family protein n=1 Tax=Tropicimonas omnivorans TaxID=3075590 RepID=A0ABU3DIU0_9RHOB|nr:terminase family protein [Roseicyclus sp. F158]MDT0683610.1 terminase family protein [Roseicyclus sp. F158]
MKRPAEQSTSRTSERRSGAAWIASKESALEAAFLESLSDEAVCGLPWVFEFWAHEHQLPPPGDWKTWVILGGRGAGKTRAGAEWVRAQVEGAEPQTPGRCRRIALIGETFDQVRDVMVLGESGIFACSPHDREPVWEAGRRRLVWPNGATATAYSAHDPEALRGPQFDGAWVDELAKWKRAEEAWDMLQFALRLGEDPRQCVTTTPRSVPVLRDILKRDSTVLTHAPTSANAAYLASSFMAEIERRYAGTRLGRQELDGQLLEEVEGALWSHAGLDAARMSKAPDLDRIVVAVDPPAGSGPGSDACGIIVAGVQMQGPPQTWRAFVLEDCTVKGKTPTGWAVAAIAAFRRHCADRLVAEVNQGGDMVRTVMHGIDPLLPFRAVHASRGKSARAEPVAALYEQGRVYHVGQFTELEDQMARMSVEGWEGSGSPDRLDALVWAIHELLIRPASDRSRPLIRTL